MGVPITLVMHCAGPVCAGPVIERSVRATIEANIPPFNSTADENGHSVPCDGVDHLLLIIINLLPPEPEDA